MKILIPVDPEIPVPPLIYGGVERLVDGLTTAYHKMGHQVILLAHKDSKAKDAHKIYPWPAYSSRGIGNVLKNSFTLLKVVRKEKPDMIHSFGRLLYLYPTILTSKTPLIMTYGRSISTKSTRLASFVAGKKLAFTCCGAHMLKNHPIAPICTPIHNFTDTEYFVPNEQIAKEHLFFLGRIEEIKGTKEAIEVAIATKQKLVIAGNIQPGHDAYFETHIKPHLTHPLIEYVGPVNDAQKLFYLQRAKAFLMPIKWEEPFGIVMAEALACGVPVIGFRRGSVPEVVKDGQTGFVVDTVEEMMEAVNKIEQINRSTARQDCEARFSLPFIAQQYLNLFVKMLSK